MQGNSDYFTGDREYFPSVGAVAFEGSRSRNPLAFKFYDRDRRVAGLPMKDHLKFSVAYWHSFCHTGLDPFGQATRQLPWFDPDPAIMAQKKADAAFEFMSKMGLDFYCFHDADIAQDGDSLADRDRLFFQAVELLRERQRAAGVSLLWNTANLFSHARYRNGAATNPQFDVLACAGHQVRTSLDAAVELGGRGYVFWGGREGYMSLLNTSMNRERDHLARFLGLCRDYARKIGFRGVLMVEPKPMEPCKHQYDFDAATVLNFLREYGLFDDFSLNLEDNHATLAGHDFVHEIQVALDAGKLDNLDINRGDPRNGWDTDQFQTDVHAATAVMLALLQSGRTLACGFNFDARIRRNSADPQDLFLAHIGGMDTYALGLLLADKIIQDGRLEAFRTQRYRSFDEGMGAEFERGTAGLEDLSQYALGLSGIEIESGRQEGLENLVNEIMFELADG